jgi:hypothetical protein
MRPLGLFPSDFASISCLHTDNIIEHLVDSFADRSPMDAQMVKVVSVLVFFCILF